MKQLDRRSFASRVQIAFLRMLSLFLSLVDSLLNVRWGERTLERMASNWERRLAHLDQSLAHLEKEREQLELQAEAIALHVATFRLGGRALSGEHLCFDPAEPGDEKILDAAIDLLVKENLAAVESEEIEPGRFTYTLEPDWAAIHARISRAASLAESEIAEMFQDSLRFIEERLLSQPINLVRQSSTHLNRKVPFHLDGGKLACAPLPLFERGYTRSKTWNSL
jgi:hypothetical protein